MVLAQAGWLFAGVLPFVVALAALLVAYSVLPAVNTHLREIWPGCVGGIAG